MFRLRRRAKCVFEFDTWYKYSVLTAKTDALSSGVLYNHVGDDETVQGRAVAPVASGCLSVC